MKTTLFCTLACIFLFSCSSPDNTTETLSIITGQVSDFSKVSEHDEVNIKFRDPVAGDVEFSTTLDSTGKFRMELDVEFPREFRLNYSGYLQYYIYPGDSLHFEIDGLCWSKVSESRAEEYAYYTVSGTSEAMNRNVALFTALFQDSLANWMILDSVVKASEPLDFRAFVDARSSDRQLFVEKFSLAQGASDDFRNWARRKITLAGWGDLIMYCWMKPPRESDERIAFIQALPDEYFSFLDEWDREDRGYLGNSDFEFFLQQYQMILDQLVPLDTQQYYQDIWQEDFARAAAYRPRYYSEAESGYARDLIIASYYYRLLDSKYYEKIKDIVDTSLIADDQARAMVTKKYRYEKDLFENMEFAEGSKFKEIAGVENFFDTMVSKYPDKVIYVDFWATWCSPCMNEMPHAKKIKKQLADKDVIFVYLGNRCEEGAWKATIAERKMEGEHYLLTDEQFAHLTTEFDFRGIPRYILVDRQGQVVNQNAPRPSSGQELVGLISQHL